MVLMTKMPGSRNNLDSDEMFDNTAGYEDETGIVLAEGLTEEEHHQAVVLYNLFNELWGLCIVRGDPGTGKDLFGNWLAYKIKTYFPWKRILRDEKPRPLFGGYAGLFNETSLKQDLQTMRNIARGVKYEGEGTYNQALQEAADDWVKGAGEVLLKNSLLYLVEFWNYCYNRESHKPINRTMGAIHKTKRHLDCLIVGTSQLIRDLDKNTALSWVDWQVTCTRSAVNPTGFTYFIQKVKYEHQLKTLVLVGSPFGISFDAGKPRTRLGDGKIILKRPKYKPETEEERVVLDVIHAGYDNYESIVDLITTDGDMTEREVLETLKYLKFKKSKRAIDYPCYFGLYNSKSAPQISTSLKGDN